MNGTARRFTARRPFSIGGVKDGNQNSCSFNEKRNENFRFRDRQ